MTAETAETTITAGDTTDKTPQPNTWLQKIGKGAFNYLFKVKPKKIITPSKPPAASKSMDTQIPTTADSEDKTLGAFLSQLQTDLEGYYAISWWKINDRKQYIKVHPELEAQAYRVIDPNDPYSLMTTKNEQYLRQLLNLSSATDVAQNSQFIKNIYYKCTNWWEIRTRQQARQLARCMKEQQTTSIVLNNIAGLESEISTLDATLKEAKNNAFPTKPTKVQIHLCTHPELFSDILSTLEANPEEITETLHNGHKKKEGLQNSNNSSLNQITEKITVLKQKITDTQSFNIHLANLRRILFTSKETVDNIKKHVKISKKYMERTNLYQNP